MAAYTCLHCGETKQLPPSMAAKRKYCSWDCRVASGSHSFFNAGTAIVYKDCHQCARTFVMRAKRCDRYQRSYCSVSCRNAFYAAGGLRDQTAWETVDCAFCGVNFETRKARLAEGKGRFCSRSCAGFGRKINGRPSAIGTAAIDEWCSRTYRPIHVREMRVGRWLIDVALPLDMIAIELDGVYWHSLPAMVDRDRRKDAFLTANGWRVLRVPIDKQATATSLADDMDRGLRKLRRTA